MPVRGYRQRWERKPPAAAEASEETQCPGEPRGMGGAASARWPRSNDQSTGDKSQGHDP